MFYEQLFTAIDHTEPWLTILNRYEPLVISNCHSGYIKNNFSDNQLPGTSSVEFNPRKSRNQLQGWNIHGKSMTSLGYPLINIHFATWKSTMLMGKLTISMAMFNSKLLVYQRLWLLEGLFRFFRHGKCTSLIINWQEHFPADILWLHHWIREI